MRHAAAAVVLLLGLHACSRPDAQPDASPPLDAASSPSCESGPSIVPVAATRLPSTSIDAGRDEQVDAGCPARPAYGAAMKNARALAAAKRWDEAGTAYTAAIRSRPYDPVAWAELGYVHLLAGNPDLAELRLAHALARDPTLLAQISWNEAMVHERAHEPEAARLALVRAERLGSKAAARKLGAASRCTVSLTARGADLPVQTGWKGVLAQLTQAAASCQAPVAASDDDARVLSCGGCQGSGDDPWTRATCVGDGPWDVHLGGMQCHFFDGVVVPLGKSRFFVEAGPEHSLFNRVARDGARWLLTSADHFSAAITLGQATYRRGEGWTDEIEGYEPGGRWPAGACPVDESRQTEPEMQGGCGGTDVAGYDEGETRKYVTSDGHFLAEITMAAEDVGRVVVAFEPGNVLVRGNGCDLAATLSTQTDAGP